MIIIFITIIILSSLLNNKILNTGRLLSNLLSPKRKAFSTEYHDVKPNVNNTVKSLYKCITLDNYTNIIKFCDEIRFIFIFCKLN